MYASLMYNATVGQGSEALLLILKLDNIDYCSECQAVLAMLPPS